jgi:hypothetical protein
LRGGFCESGTSGLPMPVADITALAADPSSGAAAQPASSAQAINGNP